MTGEEFKQQLAKRRADLNVSFKVIQSRTKLGYNTVRRVFKDPMNCRIGSVIRVVSAMGCSIDFGVENRLGDELEPDIQIQNG